MDLDPGAVKLPFDRGRADPGESGGDVLGSLGQHRLEWVKDRQPEGGEAIPAACDGGRSDHAKVARQHPGPPDVRDTTRS